jgi:hypothetical protein
MSRWTPNGWTTCLGAAFKWNFWEGRCGLDFQLESQARQLLADDKIYQQKVMRLEWIACLHKEDSKSIMSDFLPNPDSPWFALALFQRQRLVAELAGGPQREVPKPSISKNNKIQAAIDAPLARAPILTDDAGTIVIPAASRSKPQRETRTLFFPKSFLGDGQQLLLPEGTVEYILDGDILSSNSTPWQQYNLTFRICTVHRHEDPLLVAIRSDESSKEVSVNMPYTMGMWEETEPVVVVLGNTKMTLIVTRTRKQSAIGVKDIKLVPL